MIMKKVKLILSALVGIGFLATVLVGCGEDDPAKLTLKTLTANGIDLNGATSPTDVPPDAVIVAEFSTAVDETTVDAITLVRDYDDAEMDIDIEVDGKTVTITPADDFTTGTLFILNFGVGLTSTGGESLSAAIERNFTTEGTFVPNGVFAHWTFENSANDVVGSFDPDAADVIGITYSASRNAAAGMAATFNGDNSIIEIPNGDDLMINGDWSLSFWVKTNSTGHVDAGGNPAGHFVMGLAAFYGFQFEVPGSYANCKLAARYAHNNPAGAGTTSEDLWCDATGNLGWQGWVFSKDFTASGGFAPVIKDVWAHVVCVYNAATRQGIMYINGERVKEQDFDLWPDGDNKRFVTGLGYGGTEPEVFNEFAFGFVQSRAGTLWDAEPWGGYDLTTSNHFKGQLDDVRFFSAAVTATEALLMYNSEKP